MRLNLPYKADSTSAFHIIPFHIIRYTNRYRMIDNHDIK